MHIASSPYLLVISGLGSLPFWSVLYTCTIKDLLYFLHRYYIHLVQVHLIIISSARPAVSMDIAY